MATKILKCLCHNDYQNSKYGYGNRVFNEGKATGTVKVYACTVCGRKVHQ